MQWQQDKKDKMTKAVHMKLKIEQHERHKKQGVNLDSSVVNLDSPRVNLDSPEGKGRSCSTIDTCDVTLLKKISGLRRKWRNCDYDKGNIFVVISDTNFWSPLCYLKAIFQRWPKIYSVFSQNSVFLLARVNNRFFISTMSANSVSGSADHFKAFYHDLFLKFAFLNPLFSV